MNLIHRTLESTLPYRLLQATHAGQKMAPLLRANDMSSPKCVLDVGCGPGTNSAQFRHSFYVGLDINFGYLRSARRRHLRPFVVADVTRDPFGRSVFDFILVNSLLHHLSDEETDAVLLRLSDLLSPDGHIHVLDLVLPEAASLARGMALLDRGQFPRSLERWRELFDSHFDCLLFQPYTMTVLKLPFWNMFYFKGVRST